ncbi:Transient receptor potential cation channel subfamily A member 1 [Paramuricea clavata]|uniref:Transient receptor potential cation channel subfamily A member 1 n=1 Tax=Paramuricea clavata TaxID=317549 RepID=A0A7D9EIS6_PARCT|nr:Transient receptor potential cation channel subfamily A member 1 [Paramuricea clavata]
MEFIKCACDGEKDGCESCISWTGLPAKRVPQPVPDPERACHYLPVADTPLCTENDTPRPVDDWQPRANITKLFQDGEISLQQQDEITTFSETFYVIREYVVASIEHLTNLQSTKQIRSRGRAEEQRHRKERKYDEYDWINLVLQGELSKLTIPELDKYITENKLNKKGKKKDKLDAITADVLRKHQGRPIEDVLEPQHRDQASSESDSDQDIVLEEFGSESDPESETEDEPENEQIQTVDPVPLVVQTRYGRYAGNWALSELH